MARSLVLLQQHHARSIPQAGVAAASFLLCAIALFMCAFHSRKWRRWRSCYGYHNDNPVIQINSEGMVQGVHVDSSEGSIHGGGELSVWQKNILMGGKCQLPDFSGVIIYDSAGNLVSPAKTTPALTWK